MPRWSRRRPRGSAPPQTTRDAGRGVGRCHWNVAGAVRHLRSGFGWARRIASPPNLDEHCRDRREGSATGAGTPPSPPLPQARGRGAGSAASTGTRSLRPRLRAPEPGCRSTLPARPQLLLRRARGASSTGESRSRRGCVAHRGAAAAGADVEARRSAFCRSDRPHRGRVLFLPSDSSRRTRAFGPLRAHPATSSDRRSRRSEPSEPPEGRGAGPACQRNLRRGVRAGEQVADHTRPAPSGSAGDRYHRAVRCTATAPRFGAAGRVRALPDQRSISGSTIRSAGENGTPSHIFRLRATAPGPTQGRGLAAAQPPEVSGCPPVRRRVARARRRRRAAASASPERAVGPQRRAGSTWRAWSPRSSCR